MLKTYILILPWVSSCLASFVEDVPLFHEKSKTVFRPITGGGGYFGYSVSLKQGKPLELLVGAPKARGAAGAGRPGALYRCPPTLPDAPADLRCRPHVFPNMIYKNTHIYAATGKIFEEDMWLGATVTDMSDNTLVVCAPRWREMLATDHTIMQGMCFLIFKDNTTELLILSEESTRKVFAEKDENERYVYYQYAETGMSVKVSEDRSSLVVGAPGFERYSKGAVSVYKLEGGVQAGKRHHMRSVSTSTSIYDYFGYSVETGVFDSSGEMLYVAGAPRSFFMGLVQIFQPSKEEKLKPTTKKMLLGPQLGAYFGASLLCADLNGDGLSDLLVGAPNYAQRDDSSYDQGAVFVYLTKLMGSDFYLQAAGSVVGSGVGGARFGSAIAVLGDVDGDGHPEVAVGAPWEEGGRGAVYVYRAHAGGLRADHAQRISPSGARGFGIAISRGIDVDGNACNDLAVGAYLSDEAYMFRCVRTITVKTSIKVSDVLELSQNTTSFNVLFCVKVDKALLWPSVQLELEATISVDQQENRAHLIEASKYKIQATPKLDSCKSKTVVINEHSDLSRPIPLIFDLIPIRGDPSLFSSSKARLSSNSKLQSVYEIQLNECGEDKTCQPELTVELTHLSSSPFVPGSNERLGVIATILNAGEPAYNAVLNVSLPTAPVRVPSSCEMLQGNMTCRAPSPFNRGDNVTYVIELAYVQKDVNEEELHLIAEILQSHNIANKSQTVKEVKIKVLPTANMTIKGKTRPNATVHVSRDRFSAGTLITFGHYFEVINDGPSDWPHLEAELKLAESTSLSGDLPGCEGAAGGLTCSFVVFAHNSYFIEVPLLFNLREHGAKFEEEGVYEATTVLVLKQFNMSASLTTRLVLAAAPPLWPVIVGVVVGVLLLAVILYALFKRGFFSRKRPQNAQETEHMIQESTSPRGSVESVKDSAESVRDCTKGAEQAPEPRLEEQSK